MAHSALSHSALSLVLLLLLGAEGVAGSRSAAQPLSRSTLSTQQPNVIVLQPDDLPFYDAWGSPPNPPRNPRRNMYLPSAGIPNMEYLRTQGLQFMQAYTTSPACGTSRFGTMTGRYPSRSEYSRGLNSGTPVSEVTIPKTKLTGADCSTDNLAAEFRSNGYMTGVTGKWHLSKVNFETYSYEGAQESIRSCGFDHAEAIYVENMGGDFETSSPEGNEFSHNQEWVTAEAIKIIKNASAVQKPFFLYFNPTIPHPARSVESALRDFNCTLTPAGVLDEEPQIPGMTAEYGNCSAYRQSVLDRLDLTAAQSSDDDHTETTLGALWLDDSIGALLATLRDLEQLNNTVFLFQIDHAVETKAQLYENGNRIAQFVLYPDMFAPGSQFDGIVSNLDMARSVLDLAGITPSYEMDGESWVSAVTSGSEQEEEMWKDRCVFFEMDMDRAFVCGCHKFITITPDYIGEISSPATSGTASQDATNNAYPIDDEMYFYLCDSNGDYISERTENPEHTNTFWHLSEQMMDAIVEVAACHLNRTEPRKPADYSTECMWKMVNTTPGTTSLISPDLPYEIVDTNQLTYYNNNLNISGPGAFDGQDADYVRNAPHYVDNGDGTVSDLVTGLMWMKYQGARMTWQDGIDGATTATVGGYTDWRVPSTKELYSLMDFTGLDPDPEQTTTDGLKPFIDSSVFGFEYPDGTGDWRVIDVQTVTTTVYVDTVMQGAQAFFGVNFADGRIKGYPTDNDDPTFFTKYVRGNPSYGLNDFREDGEVVKDMATGLMWMRNDSGVQGLDWQGALDYCEALEYGNFTDWRLPDAKELQSLVDYSRHQPAIDPLFVSTPIVNEANETDYAYYWTSTTHLTSTNANKFGAAAAYIPFGKALGKMNGVWIDVHGAGCQRSDPKSGNAPTENPHQDYPDGRGPQGDAVRIYNKVRCTRTMDLPTSSPSSQPTETDPTIAVTTPAPSMEAFYDFFSTPEHLRGCRVPGDNWPDVGQMVRQGTACTGGLGKLMDSAPYEQYRGDRYTVWACMRHQTCAPAYGDLMCFVFDELDETFRPWNTDSVLKLA